MDPNTLLAIAHAHQISAAKVAEICDTLVRMGWTLPESQKAVAQISENDNTLVLGVDEKDETVAEQTTEDGSPQSPIGKYLIKDQLGQGGMGSIYRVYDPDLRRTLALKIIHRHMTSYSDILSRFIEEAQITAQLQHSNIIPVLDYGMLPNGQYYFTMPEINGETLGKSVSRTFQSTSQIEIKHSIHRLLEIFYQACRAVAYAHSKGVIHCDLKPDNIMVGPFGEVFVLDWGVARILDHSQVSVYAEGYLPAESARFAAVLGTPAYMAPEQARGDIDALRPQTDVYSLGLILFYILTGQRAYAGEGGNTLESVRKGQMNPLQGPWSIPQPLIDVFHKATQQSPKNRFKDANELADSIGAWLTGEQNEQRAQDLLDRALAQKPLRQELQIGGKELIQQATQMLESIPNWENEKQKWEAWALENEGHELLQLARQAGYTIEQLLQSALHSAPDFNEVHEALSDLYAEQHHLAEEKSDSQEAERIESLLQFHTQVLPLGHPKRIKYEHYLNGDGSLSLHTFPQGAHARLLRYNDENRQLIASPYQYLGKTPIINRRLPMGSYIVELEARGHQSCRYPVHITRLSEWHGRPPGKEETHPIWLPPLGALKPDECYIPAGWFACGGDPRAPDAMPAQQVWVDGFVMQAHSVTNHEYLRFLNELIQSGRQEEAKEYSPRERASIDLAEGTMIYGQTDEGEFYLMPDADGDMWEQDWPVLMVNWLCAQAYAEWYSEKTGLQWRLPTEAEWEKAGRGVDGRSFSWGNAFESTRACTKHAHPIRQLPSKPGSYPFDVSPYGVYDMCGNAMNWCIDIYQNQKVISGQRDTIPNVLEYPEGSERVFRGGSWLSTENDCRLAKRNGNPILTRSASVGIRLCRSITTRH